LPIEIEIMDSLIKDIRYGMRSLLKQPGFTLLAVITLALGIGANTAIFSVVNAVLLQPLPYRNAYELADLYLVPNGAPADYELPFTPAEYLHLRAHNSLFADVGAMNNKGWPVNLTEAGEPERLQGYQVSANLLSLLGVHPELGRGFAPEEEREGNNHVVVLSHDLWQRRFGGDRGVLNRSITLNGDSYTVIGVMPQDFRLVTTTDLWTTLGLTPKEENERDSRYMELIGRVKPGTSFTQAGVDADRVTREFLNDPKSELHVRMQSPQGLLTREVRPMLLLLLSAVGFVLLIACVNIANLTLARGTVRRRELAVRSALGASRARLVRQLLLESTLLAMAGGAFGLVLGGWAIQFLRAGLPEYLVNANTHVAGAKIDATALGFTIGISLLTTILFGLAPALQLSKVDLNQALKEGGRGGAGRSRFRSALVVTELALAMITLVGAGLMVKSLWRLAHVNPGYEPSGVLTARIDPFGARYKEEAQVNDFYTALLERVAVIPRVTSVGIINTLNASTNYRIDEHPAVPREQQPSAQMNQVNPDYFKAMGIPLRAGRFFNDTDRKGAPPVIIIDDVLAREQFPREDPIGKHLTFWDKSWEIVGVVGGTRYWGLNTAPPPHFYFNYQQVNWRSMSLVVRTQSDDPIQMTGPIRSALASIDKDQPIHSFKTLAATVSDLAAPQRFTTLVLAAFAALSALLSAIGIYGVMSYVVTQGTREIGIRMALGARRANVLRLIVGNGMTLAAAGVLLGLAGSYALTRLMTSVLFEVKPTDMTTFATVAISLLLVALLACWIPARRATKVDPLVALRYE
jgi:putative ABC transport system permease protein